MPDRIDVARSGSIYKGNGRWLKISLRRRSSILLKD